LTFGNNSIFWSNKAIFPKTYKFYKKIPHINKNDILHHINKGNIHMFLNFMYEFKNISNRELFEILKIAFTGQQTK
jgi:hypothetical protein